ncbi:MAG: hypothetical protein NC393_02545 [Clostridium sp.]|nr:hypothetical protein [Clostridium sp.]MCM1208571.1 hypothetical protein [Ruminococcus sp.]
MADYSVRLVIQMISGKIYTRDTLQNRPYYVIRYDERYEADGTLIPETTKWVAHNVSREFLDCNTEMLIKSVKQIESLLVEHEALEIEFVIKDDGEPEIGKIRELEAVVGMARPMSDKEFKDTKAFAKCNYLDFHHVLSDGSYCDTERMLGENPRPLEYSIYKELVDTGAWSESIKRLGYEGTTEEIIVKVGNKPYASINNIVRALMPKDLDELLKYKLENYYEKEIGTLKKSEKYFEQEIIISSYGFDTEEKLNKLIEKDFTVDEIGQLRKGLYEQAEALINEYDDISRDIDADMETLSGIREKISEKKPCDEKNSMKLFKYIEEMIGAVKKYGMTNLIFTDRCVIIAQGFFKALANGESCHREIIYDVSRKFWANEKKTDAFKGIIDIRGRVQNNAHNKNVSKLKKEKPISIAPDILMKYIEEAHIGLDPDRLSKFISGSIADTEKCIEEYTKCMGLISDIVIRLGDIMGIAYEDMSYLEIQDLLGYHSRDSYIQIINSRRRMYHAYTYIVLPSIICNVGDIDIIDNI